MPAHITEIATARQLIAAAVEALVDVLDRFEPDPDLEDITNTEDEGIDPAIAEDAGPGCPVADHGEHSLQERHGKQPELKLSPIHEDREDDYAAEDDDPAGGAIDDEPHDWNELEVDEGACGHVMRYGVDQSRALGPDNPEAA